MVFLKISELTLGNLERTTPRKARKWSNNRRFNRIRDRTISVGQIEETSFSNGSIKTRLRIYRPNSIREKKTICYFHGGGFVLGDLNSHDNICRRLCHDASLPLISVDYRLAPEWKFPSAHEDAMESVKWIISNGGDFGLSQDLIMAGDSSGGNLAAYCSQEFPDYVSKQVLIYPVTDLSSRHQYEKIEKSFFTTEADARWYSDKFLRSEKDKLDTKLSLVLGEDFGNIPPTFILTAEHDALKFEAEKYAALLRKNGVQVSLKEYERMVHGFLSFPRWASGARSAFSDISDFLVSPI